MDNRTPLRKLIDRVMKREAETYGPQEMSSEGFLAEWSPGAYDNADYGTQDKERRLRPIVDDDLEGWEVLP